MAMEPIYFLSNPGSSTRKYGLYSAGQLVCKARVDLSKPEKLVLSRWTGKNWKETESAIRGIEDPLLPAWESLAKEMRIRGLPRIDAGGIRVVAPGSWFQVHRFLDEAAIAALKAAESIAPLHLGPALLEIGALLPLLAGRPLVGVSDSAFHATIPARARAYAIPPADAERLDVHRFGYHGLSVQSVVRKIPNLLGSLPDRVIICHLGGGSSISAVSGGRPVDTSMGYSPLEGLIMGSRAGDLDPAVVLRLSGDADIANQGVERYLQESCGLLGLSGQSGDMRELMAMETQGDIRAAVALEAYCYRIRKYIGAYAAALAGLDLLVFTGGVGEGSPAIRKRICTGLEFLGISLDSGRNEAASEGDRLLHRSGSIAAITMIATDEMAEMAAAVQGSIKGTDF